MIETEAAPRFEGFCVKGMASANGKPLCLQDSLRHFGKET